MKIITHKKADNFVPEKNTELLLIPVKGKTTFRFVNMTKGHITSCEFDSIRDALVDLIENYFLQGKFESFSVSKDNYKG